ncbi:MAG TPA: 3-hydroxyacyl-CoA dehydrogenase NAD-binding domain-containing protein, partial [Paraburkholderia sp.]
MARIAIVGCGVVGSSWALVFSRAGFDVAVWDAVPAAVEQTLAFVRSACESRSQTGLVEESADVICARLHPCETLEDALAGVDYVQESAPERVEIKRELYKRLDAIAAPGTVLASSTSGLPASSFTEELSNRARCLVVHPINPPHLIPLVELVPAPWTDPA